MISKQQYSPNSNDDLLKTVIDILEEIAQNTGSTNDGIRELSRKELSVRVSNQVNTDKQTQQPSPNVIVAPQQSNDSINPLITLASDRKGNKTQRDYNIAKKIAGAGIN